MKKTYYHGTSADNLPLILKQGIRPILSTKRLWNDSYPNLIYMWDDTHEEVQGRGFDNAADSGSAALMRAKDRRIVVFKVVMSDKYIDPDTSSYNMNGQGAVQTSEVPKRYITEYWVSEDLGILLPLIAKSYFSNNIARLEPTNLQNYAIEKISEESYFYLSEAPIKWEHVILKQSQLKPVL